MVDGSRSDTFTGNTYSQAGVPWGVRTKSGPPLAEDFSTAVADAFRAKNVSVIVVTISPKDTREQAIKALSDLGKARALLISIDAWQTDLGTTQQRTIGMKVDFALGADVFDEKCDPLAASDAVQHGAVQDIMKGASMWTANPHSPASQQANAIAKTTLQKLLNDPQIFEALK